MAKKTTEEYITELKEMLLERDLKYVERLLNNEEVFPDELKFLKQVKSKLTYLEKLNNQLTGKTGKEKKVSNDEIMGKILEMKSSMGSIVTTGDKKTG